jgi:hypothetical protein
MPVEIEDDFAEAEEAKREALKTQKEREAFSANIITQVQTMFDETLFSDFEEHDAVVEYRCYLVLPKKGFFSRKHTQLLAQIAQYKEKARKCDFKIVVFKPEHKELAEKIASILSLVYSGDRIKIRITRKKLSF